MFLVGYNLKVAKKLDLFVFISFLKFKNVVNYFNKFKFSRLPE